MPSVAAIAEFLESFAPPNLAEEWDNIGLLVGRSEQSVSRIMTCLTLTTESVAEAVAEQANLVVSHHPLPFRPLKRLTTDSVEGRLLLELIEARIAVYSPHTAFDSAARGINQRLAEGLALDGIQPLVTSDDNPSVGTGRFGRLAKPLAIAEIVERVGKFLKTGQLQFTGPRDRPVSRIAVGCGSAGSLLDAARQQGCDCFVTGEARFHACLEAEALGIALVLAGHFATERFAVEALADVLHEQFADATVWPSHRERDPANWISL